MNTPSTVAVLQEVFWLRGEHLLMHHTNPWELDEALMAWGYTVGPCEAQDLIGLDPVLMRQPARPMPILPRMVAEGRMGKIGGVGYYRYPGGGGAVIDPLIEDLIREEAWFAKVTRVECSDDVLVTQMNAALKQTVETLWPKGVDRTDLQSILVQAVHFPAPRMALFDT